MAIREATHQLTGGRARGRRHRTLGLRAVAMTVAVASLVLGAACKSDDSKISAPTEQCKTSGPAKACVRVIGTGLRVRVQGLKPGSAVHETTRSSSGTFDPPVSLADAHGRFPADASQTLVVPRSGRIRLVISATRSDDEALSLTFSFD